jgi:hypothetical protein
MLVHSQTLFGIPFGCMDWKLALPCGAPSLIRRNTAADRTAPYTLHAICGAIEGDAGPSPLGNVGKRDLRLPSVLRKIP